MDFALLSDEKKLELAKLMLTPLNSAQEIKDWAKAFLDLEIPTENTDPASTSNPLDAAWYIYETFKLQYRQSKTWRYYDELPRGS